NVAGHDLDDAVDRRNRCGIADQQIPRRSILGHRELRRAQDHRLDPRTRFGDGRPGAGGRRFARVLPGAPDEPYRQGEPGEEGTDPGNDEEEPGDGEKPADPEASVKSSSISLDGDRAQTVTASGFDPNEDAQGTLHSQAVDRGTTKAKGAGPGHVECAEP